MLNKLITLMSLSVLAISCGPEENANLPYAVDCFDGCSRTYQEHVSDYKGDDGRDGTNSRSESTLVISTIIKEEPIVGPAGPAGKSCTVETLDDGSLILCEDGTSSFVSNGVDGDKGDTGASALVEVIDPCGAETAFDEVILVYEVNGELLYIAYFESGSKRYLTQLDTGVNYETTDGTQCRFTLDESGIVEL